MDEHIEFCPCPTCLQERIEFEAWCDMTEQRWAEAWQEGKIAHLCGSPCRNPLCPTHGDPRDTNILPLVLR